MSVVIWVAESGSFYRRGYCYNMAENSYTIRLETLREYEGRGKW
jgi:hypothetical protein